MTTNVLPDRVIRTVFFSLPAAIKEGGKAVAAGMNPMGLKRGIDLAVETRRNSRKRLNESIAPMAQLGAVAERRGGVTFRSRQRFKMSPQCDPSTFTLAIIARIGLLNVLWMIGLVAACQVFRLLIHVRWRQMVSVSTVRNGSINCPADR